MLLFSSQTPFYIPLLELSPPVNNHDLMPTVWLLPLYPFCENKLSHCCRRNSIRTYIYVSYITFVSFFLDIKRHKSFRN